MISKQQFANLLWAEFNDNLKAKWDAKFIVHGASPLQINHGQKTKFTHAVLGEIKSNLREPDLLVSFDTMHRLLSIGKLSANQKNSTLEMLCQYLGYNNWRQFQRAMEKEQLLQEISQSVDIQPALTTVSDKSVSTKNRRKILYWLMPLLLVLIGGSIYKWVDSNVANDYESIIRAANRATFAAYEALPKIDTIDISKYYVPESTAYNETLGLLIGSARKQRQLLMPQSDHEVIWVKTITETTEHVHLRSYEKWRLVWCDPNDFQGWLYDTINHQDYYLKYHNDNWKIDVNHYEGRAKRPATPVGPCH